MLALQHIYKSYKNKSVLEDVSLAVNGGEVVALIGENGAGKTTLLKVILGDTEPDSGIITLHHQVIGYVPQEAELTRIIKDSFSNQTEDWKIDYALSLVGLKDAPKTAKVGSLSGGQKTRLAFAKVLAAVPEPTVLLLDEPTNNLDTSGLAWIESFVKGFNGGIVLVSHDRTFINKVATNIAELDNGSLKQYVGNYDLYKQQKEIEYQTELEKYQSNVKQRNRLEKAVKARSEKSQHAHKYTKRSDNDKYQRDFFRNRVTVKYGQQAKALEKRLEQIENVERPETIRNYAITLSGEVVSSKLILKLENVNKSYDRQFLKEVNLEVRGNERLHIQGFNGSGKTTLLKITAGLLEPSSGKVILGEQVRIGYFSQDVDGLNYELTGYENLQLANASSTAIYREARSLGLTEMDLRKKAIQLSRGQQAKLGFAKLLLGSNQLLILDEPTNHLDIPTREQIEEALRGYKGAMLLASHDEYFVRQIGVNHTINLNEVKL